MKSNWIAFAVCACFLLFWFQGPWNGDAPTNAYAGSNPIPPVGSHISSNKVKSSRVLQQAPAPILLAPVPAVTAVPIVTPIPAVVAPSSDAAGPAFMLPVSRNLVSCSEQCTETGGCTGGDIQVCNQGINNECLDPSEWMEHCLDFGDTCGPCMPTPSPTSGPSPRSPPIDSTGPITPAPFAPSPGPCFAALNSFWSRAASAIDNIGNFFG